MKPKKIKIQKTLERTQIANFLRLLASEIEGSGVEGLQDFGVDLHNFNKLKVGLVKREGGQLDLKLKIKDGDLIEPDGDLGKEFEDISDSAYKPLKKQMAKTFKAIGRAVDKGTLPVEEQVDQFLAEAEKMVSFSGFGDDYYEQFIQECRALKGQHLNGSVQVLKQHYERIAALKKECHRRYK